MMARSMRRSSRPLYFCGLVTLFVFGSFYLTWRSAPDSPDETMRRRNQQLDGSKINYVVQQDPNLPQIVVIGADTGVRKKIGQKINDGNMMGQAVSDGQMACNVPKLELNNSEVASFFYDIPPIKCDAEKNWAYVKDATFIIDEEAIGRHGAISCSLQRFWRVDDNRLASDTINVTTGHKLEKSDFFEANCWANDGRKWRNLFMTVVPQRETIERLSKIRPPSDWSGLNVYFIGFDSVSRMTFERKMKKAYKYLVEEMQAVVLEGYNIVGDGTPQAFIPILTAQTEVELPLTRKRYPEAKYVDVYPFIWRNFSNAGYVTLYGEDAAAIGTFTYRLKGFKDQPTDHYTRTFFQRAEKEVKDLWKCIGSEPQHVTWFRYAAEFMTGYPAKLAKFLLMHHSLLSHDDLNTVMVADENFADNLAMLHQGGHLDNAVVIVMADHGHRFAKLRETHQGQLEERLPFFSIALPKAFRESKRGAIAFANLKANAHRLTTPFDIHATLADILHWPTAKQLSTPGDPSVQRSLSVFRPIPGSRSCSQANVEPHWCTCLNWEPAMDTEEKRNMTEMLAHSIVKVINAQTASERKLCAPLELAGIDSSQRLQPNGNLLRYKSSKDADGFVPDLGGHTKLARAHYQIKFRTKPGNAIYEATIYYDMKDNQVAVDLSAISHVNAYGDRPHCIIDKNYFLATYCVCYDRI